MTTDTSVINLAQRAYQRDLTVEEVNGTTKEKLEETYHYRKVLFLASSYCEIEVVEAILDKGVDINGLSKVLLLLIIIIMGENYAYYYETNSV
jgi:hypothetical protein